MKSKSIIYCVWSSHYCFKETSTSLILVDSVLAVTSRRLDTRCQSLPAESVASLWLMNSFSSSLKPKMSEASCCLVPILGLSQLNGLLTLGLHLLSSFSSSSFSLLNCLCTLVIPFLNFSKSLVLELSMMFRVKTTVHLLELGKGMRSRG